MRLQFRLNHQCIERLDANKVVSDSKNYLTTSFEDVSHDWQQPITAIFSNDTQSFTVLLDENNECSVPWELLQEAGLFKVSAFCSDLHTADEVSIRVYPSGYKAGETPSEPTPSVYDQLTKSVEQAVNTANSVRSDADAGLFKGEKGDKGDQGIPGVKGDTGAIGAQGVKGDDGYSPIRGIDYWTQADQQPIIDATNAANAAATKAEKYAANQPKHAARGELIAVDDAFSDIPLSLTVEGKTVKDETGLTCVENATVNIGGAEQANPVQLPIELKSNKLCSLPNGVHDELRVTREGDRGHVELIKNVSFLHVDKGSAWEPFGITPAGDYRYSANIEELQSNYNWGIFQRYVNGFEWNFLYNGATAGQGYVSAHRFLIFSQAKTVEEFKTQIPASGYTAIIPVAEKQTIDLGYIDLPTLPAPNATVWTSSNLPAVTTEVEYVQDINIVLDKLMQAIVAAPAAI